MRIRRDSDICIKCGKCLDACPNKPTEYMVFECQHCDPDTALCRKTCSKNAFFESFQGVLVLDTKKCATCRECTVKCDFEAIKPGHLIKCDLCMSRQFPECVKVCPVNALSVDFSDELPPEKVLGWKIKPRSSGKRPLVLKENESRIICSARNAFADNRHGSSCQLNFYEIVDVPELSGSEAKIVSDILLKYKQKIRAKEDSNIEMDLKHLLEGYCDALCLELDDFQESYLFEIIKNEITGFGPLSCLMKDDEIEEIALIGDEKPVYVFHNSFGWLATNLFLTGSEKTIAVINKMARSLGRRVTFTTPRLNASISDGSRMHAVIPPLALDGCVLTIRKFRSKPFTPADLISSKTINLDAMSFLCLAMLVDSSMVIAGNTGSGKTTTLNALFSFVPIDERIIVTEETPEINLPHPHVVRLAVNDSLKVSMSDLVLDSLRMRPDRVIVGEVRDEREAKAFMNTVLAGQGKGSFATFHAQSASEALLRLKNLGVLGIDLPSIDLIVVQRRWTEFSKEAKREVRKIVEISEIKRSKDGAPEINTVFEFDHSKGKLKKAGSSVVIKRKVEMAFRGEKFAEKLKHAKKKLRFVLKNSDGGFYFDAGDV
ncbi:MAG: Flp pilus assembly complex ATPase component TadA [Candidatus Diapherotrites archaeon]|nr:Flp pilus assembly complex ATPase component TadA [Candidatus Diapherotrites archaeon]